VSIIVWLIVSLIAGMALGGRGFGVLSNIVVGIIGGFLATRSLSGCVRVHPPEHPGGVRGVRRVPVHPQGSPPDPSNLNDRVHWRSGPFTKVAARLGPFLRLSAIAPKSGARGTRHVLHLDIDGETTSDLEKKHFPKL
jgi:hypothetical protein